MNDYLTWYFVVALVVFVVSAIYEGYVGEENTIMPPPLLMAFCFPLVFFVIALIFGMHFSQFPFAKFGEWIREHLGGKP